MATFRRLTLAFMLFLICLPILSSIVEANIVIYDSQGTAITYAHEPYIINPTNTTYQDHNLMLNVKFYAEVWGSTNFTMVYSLDGAANQTFPLFAKYVPFSSGRHNESTCSGTTPLPGLTDGLHIITVYLKLDHTRQNKTGTYHEDYYDKETAIFSVGSSTVPQFILPSTTNTETQDPSPPPTMPEFSMLAIVTLMIAIVPFVILVKHKKYQVISR